MALSENKLKLEALELALIDLDRIIETLKSQSYPEDQINEYVKKRWSVWNEIYQVKNHEKNL
jgi:hypothetical protein